MKINLNKTRISKIRDLFLGATISYGRASYFEQRKVEWKCKISDFYFDKDLGKFVVEGEKFKLTFRDFLVEIYKENKYKTTSKKIKELAKKYIECINLKDEKAGDIFNSYLDSLGNARFVIEDVDIIEDEVEWLNKHVTRIKATFPPKYLKDFKKNFDTDQYIVRSDSWNYSFVMYFDSVDNIPESLLTVKNANGNNIDMDDKCMYNTSYIWQLVKKYPNLFNFGKREIR